MRKIGHIKYGCAIALVWAAPAFAQPASEARPANDSARTSADDAESSDDGTIIITATKRTTDLQTTTAAVSVVGAEDIENRHLSGADDYLQSVPGVAYQERGPGSNSITIRGVGQGSQLDTNSPVGTYFGETPLNGLGSQVNGNQAGNSDVKLIDIKQIEVLRGPQGTLYGSGTMGGTVRVLPNAPNLSELEGVAYGEYSNTARNGGNNYKFHAVINAPLIQDKLGVRVVAYKFSDDGYYNNLAASHPTANILAVKAIVPLLAVRDEEHSGAYTSTGFRATALWEPTDRLSLSLMYLTQSDKTVGIPSEDVGLGAYNQARVGVGLSGRDRENVGTRINLINGIASYDLGFGSLLNSTSIISTAGHSDIELTFFSAAIFAANDAPSRNAKDVFINETRFTSDWGGPFQVLGGVYYENRRFDINSAIAFQYPQSPIPAAANVVLQASHTKNYSHQLAFFGEGTLKLFDDKLTIVGGARHFQFDVGIPVSTTNGVVNASTQGRTASIQGWNFKGSVAYEISKQLFVYGLISEGFRAPIFQNIVAYNVYDPDGNGLINFADGIEREVPEGLLQPDSTRNYELGVKFRTVNNLLRGSLTAYQIDWSGIPVSFITCCGGAAYYINAGKASVKGVEFEAEVHLPAGFDLSGSVAYTKSVLAETSPLGAKGTRLPGSPQWNAHVGLQKNFQLGEHESFARVDYVYVGDYFSTLAMRPPASGDYSMFNASGGITFDRFNLGVFVKNITNSQAVTWYDNTFTSRIYRVRPRTIGVSLGAKF